MSGITYEYMEKYIRDLIPENEGILREMEQYAEQNNVPIIQKEAANFLELMINMKKPKRILELGTAIGYSSILMCMSAHKDCNIITVERNENMIKLADENIKKYGFDNNISIIEGDCQEVLEALCNDDTESFDIIFMDAGKGHYNHFLPYCLKLLKKEGIIIADNVLFRGMVASKELVKRRKITIVKRMRKYLEMISNKEEFTTSVIPMGDGIAVTMRRNSCE
jgi:predicted O-methyltransferase YrrM